MNKVVNFIHNHSNHYVSIYLFIINIYLIGTKVDSDTIAKRKRQLVRAVIDETRGMVTKIRDTKKNTVEINLALNENNTQENVL